MQAFLSKDAALGIASEF